MNLHLSLDPFMLKEEDKPLNDSQMQRLVHLGILTQDMAPYSSPIMLIARKNSHLKRIITDIRFLNSRLLLQAVYCLAFS